MKSTFIIPFYGFNLILQTFTILILAVACLTILAHHIFHQQTPSNPNNFNLEGNELDDNKKAENPFRHPKHHIVRKRSPKLLSKYAAVWSKKAKVLSVISPIPTSRLYFKMTAVFDKALSKVLFKVPFVGRKRRSPSVPLVGPLEVPPESIKILNRVRRSPKIDLKVAGFLTIVQKKIILLLG